VGSLEGLIVFEIWGIAQTPVLCATLVAQTLLAEFVG
jgi:hypothetical protein